MTREQERLAWFGAVFALLCACAGVAYVLSGSAQDWRAEAEKYAGKYTESQAKVRDMAVEAHKATVTFELLRESCERERNRN